MFKGLGKSITKSLVIWIFIWVWILIAYAEDIAEDIIDLTQTVDPSDKIKAQWFNTINTWINSINSKLVNVYNNWTNVGIWTSSPESKLHVDNGTVIISTNSWSPRLKLVNTSLWSVTTAPSWEIDNASDLFRIFRQPNISTAWVAHLVINNSWSVWIWTSTPEAKLDVSWQIVWWFWGQTSWWVTDWNDLSNSRSWNGYTLLQWTSTNWPAVAWWNYFHSLNFEFNSKNWAGNITQLAIPYGNAASLNQSLYLRGRYSWTWSSWAKIISENTSWLVGIWTNSPSQKLHVEWNIYSTWQPTINNAAPTIYFKDTDHRSAMIHNNNNILYILRWDAVNSSTWAAYWWYWPLNINLENNNAQFWWAVSAPGWFATSSDLRLKKDLIKIENPITKIKQLNWYNFTWKNSEKKDLGVIAQEVEQVFPELVSESKNALGESYKTVNYWSLIAPLIEAIKEQQKEIDELKKEINKIKNSR